ncbi:MAG TPA: hypothetical protein DDX89_08420 [Candidatus Omnitrophica bacterium]|nr:MAG: hypothetical protein A2Z92_01685 [Omnitrophica WOR_2 bacterium GWA2_63_20]OGX33206.1 MAG: hypothetical protein A3E56_00875 [Omnitrophica WOR_2 bacterium RIFCSPHIGHO2_12_FULL_64_13]OGX36982.1 MAG: hypothetical protein A3B73_01605 [Omnitrophica WOR_2 bacterium RIFCSPHIGHO2_02_FULL_63_39]OGX46412.1 MAG: hypothetical protein A3I71_02940 [Omnitrophica WOR_2 bacterium RIFCSPLOWO2_02_FULL_63_16]OGX49836.1 MAG: hypothetical protein A3G88_01340 [Omnitrophica WOR_2 bacterium RIFCSPLOWO2_12_FULL_6
MPTYAYRAKDRALKVVEGTIDAENETAAVSRLGTLGIYPLILSERGIPRAVRPPPTSARAPSRVLAYFSRQLADLLSGGLSLLHALSLVAQQTDHRALRAVIEEVADDVREGRALSEALAKHPGMFSPLYLSLIKTGEATGELDAVLMRLAEVTESESELKSRVASAFVYPCLVLLIGLGVIAFLLTYVVPKLTTLFLETGQLLPWPTRLLLGVSAALSRWWWAWAGGVILGGWAGRQGLRSETGQSAVDRLILRLPVVSPFVRKLDTARAMRNLGVMLERGVPILQALDVAGTTLANRVLREALRRARDEVRAGQTLARALSASGQFPVFVSNMVAVGEEANTLDAALLKVASSYERETEQALRVLTTVLEPVVLVVVGVVVMFIVISVLLPIFELGLGAQ